ncbi:unnamed protein product [Closterium sp. NIES-53]
MLRLCVDFMIHPELAVFLLLTGLCTTRNPSTSPVLARISTVLPCPATPSISLTGLHIPSFATNLVSTSHLQYMMVTTTTPGGELVASCTDTVTGDHLAMFTHRPGSGLYTQHTESAHVAASGQVDASCSCRLLTHPSLLWHHRLGHPSLQRLCRMHFRLLGYGRQQKQQQQEIGVAANALVADLAAATADAAAAGAGAAGRLERECVWRQQAAAQQGSTAATALTSSRQQQ